MSSTPTSSAPRLALMFPGQGSQRPGMGRPWADRPGWAAVERASEISGQDVAALLLDADEETLRRTDNAQLATFVLEWVILGELREEIPAVLTPTACAGHSLGEYTALAAAGVIGFDDAVRLVAARGRAMRGACAGTPGTMSAVLGLDLGRLEQAAAELRAEGARVWVANLNSPQQAVLSGDPEGVARCAEAAERLGALRVQPLTVDGAFHTPLMLTALPAFGRVVDSVRFGSGRVPVVANVDGRPYWNLAPWPELLKQQMVSPVRWTDSVRTLVGELGCDLLVEIGPGRALGGMAKAIAPAVPRLSISEPSKLALLPA
ncbi:ACP S-malonyltransferase [Kitasatospora sp. GP82]|uniref:ACP S-malonyltransferase n=1 Tax=Kitasatospora sp. GP82 TaxID=3035089 RepID=UPI002474C7D4|nr:ACP S-malonyltransferase [Kitasatospora sp. GP82]MDH6125234.1 [acyl-carrier-protein] S-malonyltransferase [Kitasatospora sp. GP82]